MKLTRQDAEAIAQALYMRRNYIETGTVTMSASDAISAKKSDIIRPLDSRQKKRLVRLEELAEAFLRATSGLPDDGSGDDDVPF